MLRLLGFFLAALGLTLVLRDAPVVGALFRVPLLGFWLSAVLLSLALSIGATRLVAARRFRNEVRALGAVDTPLNRGKLGALLLARGRARAALPHLVAAAAEDPERLEWAYRLGEARLVLGDGAGALAALDPLLARDEEHAFGRALLVSARAARAAGDAEGALGRLARHARAFGPTAEADLERGFVLRALGQRGPARDAFRSAAALAGPRQRGLAARAWCAATFGL